MVRQLVLWALVVLCWMAALSQPAIAGTELEQLRVERTEDGIYLSANIELDLAPAVEDALYKGVPLFFVVEADVLRDRWYWTDRRVVSAKRTIRLAFQPLTRRWRVNVVSSLSGISGGGVTLNQNYETLRDALSAVQRVSRWKIAESSEIDTDAGHKLTFRFRLDLSQLPRPFQIGIAGQRDWSIFIEDNDRLKLETVRFPAGLPTSGSGPKDASK